MKVSPRRTLSAVIIAFNEAHRIGGCLESLGWVDEIVVVDNGSTDGTQDLARKYTDKVFFVPWRGYGKQKQAAVDRASNDLVFNIDCDERVTPELAEEILEILSGKDISAAYSIPRKTFIGNKEIKHCGWYPDRKIRLLDRTRAGFSEDLVHEDIVVPSGKVLQCKHHLLHYSFKGMSDLLAKMNHFTDIAALQLFERGRKSNLIHVTLRPLFTFLKTYILKLGFLDGFEGFEVAVSNSLSVFYKYAKLRELVNKE